MFAKWFTLTATVSISFGILMQSGVAIAAAPLTDARVKAVINQVLIALKNQSIRDAHLEDRLTPGDWLSTKRSSRADLRFNDGTFARVGELSTFGFRPNQRYYDLRQGTFLFVIPPNKGGSTFHTPNATAGVRGSALFIRYIEADGITIVGALTNNPAGPMEITNQDGSQTQDLRAGQLAVVQKDKIIGIYEFDLRTFYNTSNLVEGLDLQGSHGKSADPDIALVQVETTEALKEQTPFQGDATAGTPDFFKNPDHRLAANSEPYGVPNQLMPTGLSNLSTAIPPVIDGYSRLGRPIVPTQTQPTPPQTVSVPLSTPPNPSSQLPTPGGENPSLGSIPSTTPVSTTPQPPVLTPVTPTPPAAITTPAPTTPQPPVLTPVTPTPPAAITTPVPTTPQLPNPGLPTTPAIPATPPTVPQQPPVLTPVTPTPPAAINTPPAAPQLPNPGLPATPAIPATPATPATPAIPATPATPATSATTPTAPAIPATPAAPATTTQQPNPGLQTTPPSPTTPPATN